MPDICKISISGLTQIKKLTENYLEIPDRIRQAIEIANINPAWKNKLLEAVKTLKIGERSLEIQKDEEIEPGVWISTLIRAVLFGSASLGIKPQLNLKELLLK